MTQLMDCTLYYSSIGESFNIYERNTDANLVRTEAQVHLSVDQYAYMPVGDTDESASSAHREEVTRLMIPHGVKGGSFFSSDTQCIIVNGKNQILRLGGKYRFPIRMYRDLHDPNLFSVIFKNNEFNEAPCWVSL